MSSPDPILILQMQRMGDLVLSYPLCGWLSSVCPDSEIWLVGEKIFFEGLVDISPAVTYFDYSAADLLKTREYRMVINLSHRREAAVLAGQLKTELRLGPYVLPAGSSRQNSKNHSESPLYIEGAWQLYRASINHNNRHNLFHWADLNAMDLVATRQMRRTSWPPLKQDFSDPLKPRPDKRVGLFLGASEADKRPDAVFWAQLADRLMRLGTRPALMGGQGDIPLGNEVAGLVKAPSLNLCGKFSIKELCLFMKELDLLIVPDTGPMHIAAWVGLPVINLSMGPVNAWETGPFAPGHYVLRSSISCVGCWACDRPQTWCKNSFAPAKVAEIAGRLLENRAVALESLDLTGLQLFRTARDEFGLFDMRQLTKKDCLRLERSRFWKMFFGLALDRFTASDENLARIRKHARSLRRGQSGQILLRQGQAMLLTLNKSIRSGKLGELANENHWRAYAPLLRPLSSYLQYFLHNAEFSRPARLRAVQWLEFFLQLVQHK